MTDPTPLSPAAQAVWDAAWQLSPVNCESHEDRRRQQIAAALRAAANQVVPENAEAVGDKHDDARADQWMRIRYKLLAIAAELDGTQSFSENV